MSIFISSFKKASKLKKGMRPQSLIYFFSSWWLKITLFLKKKKLFPLNFADFRLFDGVLVLSVLLHFIQLICMILYNSADNPSQHAVFEYCQVLTFPHTHKTSMQILLSSSTLPSFTDITVYRENTGLDFSSCPPSLYF